MPIAGAGNPETGSDERLQNGENYKIYKAYLGFVVRHH
jgi:hypothetical protein